MKRVTKMKKAMILRLFAVAVIAIAAFGANLQAKDNETAKLNEIKFKTSAYSFMCKNQIENELNGREGVSEAYLDLDSKVVTVKYNPAKTSTDKIANGIKSLGYETEKMESDCSKKEHKCCDKKKKS
jgi:copper chaperone CopZ